jgi:hypothetical protein
MDGFRADPEDLTNGASGILECLKPAENVDLEALSRDMAAFGHPGFSNEFAQFSATWQVAYTLLQSRATQAAQVLKSVAENYAKSDDEAGQSMSPRRAAAR